MVEKMSISRYIDSFKGDVLELLVPSLRIYIRFYKSVFLFIEPPTRRKAQNIADPLRRRVQFLEEETSTETGKLPHVR